MRFLTTVEDQDIKVNVLHLITSEILRKLIRGGQVKKHMTFKKKNQFKKMKKRNLVILLNS
jgi:hypothetical protein